MERDMQLQPGRVKLWDDEEGKRTTRQPMSRGEAPINPACPSPLLGDMPSQSGGLQTPAHRPIDGAGWCFQGGDAGHCGIAGWRDTLGAFLLIPR